MNSVTIFGDPTPIGFATVAAYAIAAVMCVRASHVDLASSRIWAALALLMFALGVNKQLDLQSVLTQVGRGLAQSEHWYEFRRSVQLIFVLGVFAASVMSAIALGFLVRGRARPVKIAVLGTVILAFFVTVRAASFHHVDVFLAGRWIGLPSNMVLELGGILLIAGAAARAGSLRAGHLRR